MGWELSRANFRRLVQLYLVLSVLLLGWGAYESFSSKWAAFSTDFDLLAEQHFGPGLLSETMPLAVILAVGLAVVALLVWGLASTIGLLFFKRWARFGFWVTYPAALLLVILTGPIYPTYSTYLDYLFEGMANALWGVIVVLAYSRDHGSIWFNDRPTTSELD